MTARAQVLIAELRIVCDRNPTATLVCHICRMDPHVVRGQAAVIDFVGSNPLHDHRLNCPGQPAVAAA